MGMEITVIDDSDAVGWVASVSRLGEIHMNDVRSMVVNVIAMSQKEGRKLSRLNILDHGSPSGFEIGTDHISSGSLPVHATELAKLKPIFEHDGFVHLQHCQIGQNPLLLAALAKLLGVSVYAGKEYQNPLYRLNYGGTKHTGWLTKKVKMIPNPFKSFEEYVRVDPDGKYHDNVGRP